MVTLKIAYLCFALNFVTYAAAKNTKIHSKAGRKDYTHINRISQVNQPQYNKWSFVADKTSKTLHTKANFAAKLSRYDSNILDNVLDENNLKSINTDGDLKLAQSSIIEQGYEKSEFIDENWSAHRAYNIQFTGQFQTKQSVTNGRVTRSVNQNNNLHIRNTRKRNNNTNTSPKTNFKRKCPRLPKSKRYMEPICTRGRKVGSRCALKCKPGYYMPRGQIYRRFENKQTYRRCKQRRNGKRPYWTSGKNTLKCVPKCTLPQKLEHGSYSCRIIGEDYICKFSCAKNYKLWGSEHRRCIYPSYWTGDPASCSPQPEGEKAVRKATIRYQLQQNFTCGNIRSLTAFKVDTAPYLVAADYQNGRVKIYKWNGEDSFMLPPIQEIFYFAPLRVEILRDLHKTTWLLVANLEYMTYYRLMPNGLFVRSHSNSSEIIIPKAKVASDQQRDTIAFAELRGDIYRCYGRNRRQNRRSPVVIVQKLQGQHRVGQRKTVFQRIMRKRLSNEYVRRCSMYADRGSIYTIVALNKDTFGGRIIIGEASNKQRGMKVVTTISGDSLNRLSDSVGFSDGRGDRYIVASQDVPGGECMLYKRLWRPRV